MSRIGEINPFYLKLPYTIRTWFNEAKDARRAAGQPGVLQTDELTVELRDWQQLELVF